MFHFPRRFYMRVLMLILWGLIVGICPAVQTADVATTDRVAQALDILGRLEAKYKETQTFIGEFRQLKKSELFLEEIRSNGLFWYQKPGKFRCEYLPPNAQVNLVLSDVTYIYTPEIKQVEIYHFNPAESPVKKLNQMLLGFGVSVEDVLEVYDVRTLKREETKKCFALLFKPRKKDDSLQFDAIKLWVTRKTLIPKRLVFLESGGDRTEITITKVKFNKRIKPSIFKPDFPRDAEVIEQN